MNILFISMTPFKSNASAVIRNSGILEGLCEIGHNVDILTLRPEEQSVSFDQSMNGAERFAGREYHIEINKLYGILMAKKNSAASGKNAGAKNKKRPGILRAARNTIVRLYRGLFIFDAQKINAKGVRKLQIDYSKYEVIISSSDPKSSHLIAAEIKKRNKNPSCKMLQYWGDPMLNDITRKKSRRDFYVKHCEQKLIKIADKVIYASPLTLEVQQKTFPRYADKMDFANQAAVNRNKTAAPPPNREDAEIKAGYFGSYMSKIRDIIPLYNAALNSGFKLTVCGSSDIALKSTENITIAGKVSYGEVLKREEESDILICLCNRSGTQIPGKIYYCASLEKPVIVILDGEHAEALRAHFDEFERYILCENNEESIKKALREAVDCLNNNGEYKLSERLKPAFLAERILSGL